MATPNINQVPDINALRKYAVNRSNDYEVIGSALYDYTTYLAAGQTELNFFQTPQGQGGKSLADTNMESAGSLPKPKNFIVTAVEVNFWAGDNPATFGAQAAADRINDLWNFSKSGYLEFYIGSKNYIQEGPMNVFPPFNGLVVSSSLADVSTTGANMQSAIAYGNMGGKPYQLASPVTLMSNQNFRVSLKWPVPVAISADARVGVRLRGYLYRLSQ